MDRAKGTMERAGDKPGLVKGLLKNASKLFSIPVIGTANCGPAQIFAEPNFQGFLKVSGKLIKRSRPDGLFAVKADGASMNRAIIDGKNIEDGDYVIINSEDRTPDSNNVVLVIIENKATIKRFIDDRENGQVVLKADSSFDFEPIYLHPEDEFFINGKAVAVVKNV
jgi:repressor LexA